MKNHFNSFCFVLLFLVSINLNLFSQNSNSEAPASTTPPSDITNTKTTTNTNNNPNKVTTDYYAGSSVTFCEGVDETTGDAKTPATLFTISSDGGYAYVLIKHTKPFKTTELIIDIWKGQDYKDFVDTKNITIEDNWQWTYFQYTFKGAGKYKFAVYNKDQTWIETGFVTIEVQ